MSIQPLIFKNGVYTLPRSAADIEALKVTLGISTSNFVDLSTNQTINGIKTFSGALRLPSSEGSLAGHIWRSGDALQYRDGANITKTILNSAGNLSNLADKQVSLNNLVNGQVANRVLRSNGINITLSQVALDTDVINVLPIANGGTGSNTQNFVDLTSAQTIAGNKTLTGIIKVKNAWLLEARSNTTQVDANAIVYPQFAGTQWLDGSAGNLNTPVGFGMIHQFDSLLDSLPNKYRVQEFITAGGGVTARVWKRTESNGVWGTWLEIGFLEKANTWTGVQVISNSTAATSTTTGAFRISAGGGSVIGNWYIGGSLVCTSNTINFSALPTSSSGLSAGSLWRSGTIVNVVV